MPKKRVPEFPHTFDTSNQGLLRQDLERFSNAMQEFVSAAGNDDLRPLRTGDPLGPGGQYLLDPSGSPIEIALPDMDPADAGESITLIRTSQGTATVYAVPPASVSGEAVAYVPAGLRVYQLIWTGENWYWSAGAPGSIQGGGGGTWRRQAAAWELDGVGNDPRAGVTLTATLFSPTGRSSAQVRAFPGLQNSGVLDEFTLPTGAAGDLRIRTMHAAQSAPTGHAVVNRLLRYRELSEGSFVPSGFRVYTLPAVTLPSGSRGVYAQNDRIPIGELGVTDGAHLQLILERQSASPYASPDLAGYYHLHSVVWEVDS